MKTLFGLMLLVLLTGCSVVSAPIVGLVKSDVDRAKEIADKYGDEVASRCYTYLSGALANDVASEEVKGLISTAELARVLRNHIDKNEAAFKQECGQLAGEVVIELARRARN